MGMAVLAYDRLKDVVPSIVGSVYCQVTGCSSQPPEINRDSSNEKYLGGLYLKHGKIYYEAEEKSTGHKMKTRSCGVSNPDGVRTYSCLSPKGDVSYEISCRDAIPGVLEVQVNAHGRQRIERLYSDN
jgi:hypothetical protein